MDAFTTNTNGKRKEVDDDQDLSSSSPSVIKRNANLPWVEKYRPSGLDEIVSHSAIITTIEKFIKVKRVPHLLFYGPPGTGKTTTILAIARQLYGPNYRQMVLELNASDDRGIDVVRSQIKTFASTKTIYTSSQFKLIILDEADAMTVAAQAALRRIIEKYSRNVRFCIICNYVNKIAPAILSRCTRFRFSPLPTNEIQRRLDVVIGEEKTLIDGSGREALLKLSRGDMRKALNILQACHSAYNDSQKPITDLEIYTSVGAPHPQDIDSIVQSAMSEEFYNCLNRINAIKQDKGLALQDILGSVYEALEDIELPKVTRMLILDQMATIEYRLSLGASEAIQLSALIASIKTAISLKGVNKQMNSYGFGTPSPRTPQSNGQLYPSLGDSDLFDGYLYSPSNNSPRYSQSPLTTNELQPATPRRTAGSGITYIPSHQTHMNYNHINSTFSPDRRNAKDNSFKLSPNIPQRRISSGSVNSFPNQDIPSFDQKSNAPQSSSHFGGPSFGNRTIQRRRSRLGFSMVTSQSTVEEDSPPPPTVSIYDSLSGEKSIIKQSHSPPPVLAVEPQATQRQPVTITVFGFPSNLQNEIIDAFTQFGEVGNISPESGSFRITYRDSSSADKALRQNGVVYKNHMIGVTSTTGTFELKGNDRSTPLSAASKRIQVYDSASAFSTPEKSNWKTLFSTPQNSTPLRNTTQLIKAPPNTPASESLLQQQQQNQQQQQSWMGWASRTLQNTIFGF